MPVESHQAPFRRRFAGLVLSSLVGVAACSADDASGTATPSPATTIAPEVTPAVATTERPVDTTGPPVSASTPPGGAVLFAGDDFYAVPDPLPAGEPGTLLRYEPIELFGGWSNVGDSPGEFVLQTLGTRSGEVVLWRDPVALRPERVDRPIPDEAVGRSATELAAWLVEHPELDATDPEPVSVGGLDGFEVEVAIAPQSTNAPAMCPSGQACVDLFAPPHLGFAWRLVTRGDRARLILLATADGTGTVLIALDPYDHLGTDAGGVRHAGPTVAGQHRLHRRRARRTSGRRVRERLRVVPWCSRAGCVQVSRVRTIVQLHGWPARSGWASSVADDVPVRVDPGRADRGHRHRRGAVDRGAGRRPPDPQRRPRHHRHRRSVRTVARPVL